MKYLAILKDSLYEALDTKVFYVMLALSCLALLVVASTSYAPAPAEARIAVSAHGTKVTRSADWPHEATLFFALPIHAWRAPVGAFVHFWEDTLINTIGAAVTLLISAVITAFFSPIMLRKGTVDL